MKATPAASAFLLLVVAIKGVYAQPPLAAEDARVVEKWLQCGECIDGERAALARVGTRAVPALAGALRNGPPTARRDDYSRRLSTRYRAMVEHARTHPDSPVSMTEQEYLRRHIDNFVELYEIRGVQGLGLVGGPAARSELTQALSLPLPPAVLVAVRRELQRFQ